jgi:hypothetical protein
VRRRVSWSMVSMSMMSARPVAPRRRACCAATASAPCSRPAGGRGHPGRGEIERGAAARRPSGDRLERCQVGGLLKPISQLNVVAFVQVSISVHRDADTGMPQPLLNGFWMLAVSGS